MGNEKREANKKGETQYLIFYEHKLRMKVRNGSGPSACRFHHTNKHTRTG